MTLLRKCPKCAFEITDASAIKCPLCGTPLLNAAPGNLWIGTAIQIAFATTFMLMFRFPKNMIAVFVGMILIGALFVNWVRSRSASMPRPQLHPPLTNPALFRLAGAGVVLCMFAIFTILLFGSVTFLNSWNRWQRYEGQPSHHADFVVEHAYYQKHSKGVSLYASGTVEDQREWTNLEPYLHTRVRSQAELDGLVPPGTSIPIYLFPNLKGRARVQIYGAGPPAEMSHRAAMAALNDSLIGLAIAGTLLFFMKLIQRNCVRENEFQPQQFSTGNS